MQRSLSLQQEFVETIANFRPWGFHFFGPCFQCLQPVRRVLRGDTHQDWYCVQLFTVIRLPIPSPRSAEPQLGHALHCGATASVSPRHHRKALLVRRLSALLSLFV